MKDRRMPSMGMIPLESSKRSARCSLVSIVFVSVLCIIFDLTSSSSTAGKEARIQTGALPAVVCASSSDFLVIPGLEARNRNNAIIEAKQTTQPPNRM